jgi:YVTN family beta-propeller protein
MPTVSTPSSRSLPPRVAGRRLWPAALLVAAALVDPLAAKGTGKVFVSNEKSSTITVLDASGKVLHAVDTCARPRGMKFNPQRTAIYVGCADDNMIALYDLATMKLGRRYRSISAPETFDLHPNGRHLYISNEDDSEASVLDVETGEIIARYPTGPEPEGVLITRDGRLVFVASEVANLVHVIDTGAGRVVAKGRVEFSIRAIRRDMITPVDLVITKDGTRAYVALGRANYVAVVDTRSRQVLDYILVGKRPWGLMLSQDERQLWVANGLSDDISIIDTKAGKVLVSVPVGRVPYGILIDD